MQMTINKITCNTTCSGLQKDNVFLLIQADAGPPIRYPTMGWVDMGADDTMTLPEGGYVIHYTYGVIVTAWDEDSLIFKGFDSPDYLFNISVGPGSYTSSSGLPVSSTDTKYNHNGAKYTFTTTLQP